MPVKPIWIFFARFRAFLDYRTRIGLTWLELLAAMLAGMVLVWDALRNWTSVSLLGPFAVYLVAFGFYRRLAIPIGWLRGLYEWLAKPLAAKPEPKKRYYAYALIIVALIIAIFLARFDQRVALLYVLLLLASTVLLVAIHSRETTDGALNLRVAASRLPIAGILRNGEVVHRDGTRARVSIITFGKSGYKPALKPVDVADMLTKFFAYLAQQEDGGVPIKLFWLTDSHLGKLDLPSMDHVSPDYLR